MAFRLLLDEMTETALAEYLRKMGHDIVRVVDETDLGPGTDDSRVVEYAERIERLVVTYDDDFLAEHDAIERIGVLFQSDGRLSAFETANVVNEISERVEQEAIVAHGEAYHLTTEWL